MANANINVDLSQSIQNVEGLAKAVEKLAQSLGSVLQLSGQLQGSMATIQGVAGAASSPSAAMGTADSAPVAGSMFSKAGQAAGDVSDKYDAAQLALYKKTAESIAAGQTDVSGGFHRGGTRHGPGGNYIPKLMEASLFNKMKSDDQAGSLYSSIKATASGSGLVDPYGNPAKSALKDQVASTASASERSSVYNPDSMYGIGITKADVGKAISAENTGETAKGQDRIASAIEQLNQASKGADDSKVKALADMVQLLQTVGDNMRDSSKELAEANKNVRETSRLPVDSPKRIAALNQQDIATGKVGSAYGMAGDLIQHADGMAPPGGAPPSRWNRFGGMAGKAAGGLGGLIGLASAATIGYMGAEQVLDQATYGSKLAGEQSKALSEQDLFKTSLEEADMTKAANVIKYRGNILFPDEKQRFTGTSGFDNAMKAAYDMETQSRGMEERERGMSLEGAGTSAGLGALGIIGGATLALTGPVGWGAAAGLAAMGAGTYGAISGIKGLAAGEFGSKYTAMEGGLNKGIAGSMGRGMHGARWNELASDSQYAQEMISRSRIVGNARALQEAETKQQQGRITAYQSILDLEDTEKYGVTLAGPDAMTKEGVMAMYRAEADASGITATKEVGEQWLKTKEAIETRRANVLGYSGTAHGLNLMSADQQNTDNSTKAPGLAAYQARRRTNLEGRNPTDTAEYVQKLYEDITGKEATEQGITREHTLNTVNYVNNLKRDLNKGVQGSLNAAQSQRISNLPAGAVVAGIEAFGQERFMGILGGASATGLDPAQRNNYIKAISAMPGGEKAAEDMQKVFQQRELRPSVFAQLGISASEYMQRHAEITSTLGVSKAEGEQLTGRALTMSRSGMGSFQQMMGNLSQISAVSGGRGENLDKLETVMSAAVAAGFDKSRMAQQFVSTTTQLAQSTKSRDVEGVAARLSVASRFMGTEIGRGVKADELSLRVAAEGMQGYNQFTAQTQGPMGAFKAMGLLGAGAEFNSSFMATMKMGSEEYGSRLAQLKPGAKISDPSLTRALAARSIAIQQRKPGMTNAEADEAARAELTEEYTGANKGAENLIEASMSSTSQASIAGYKKRLETAKGDELKRQLKGFYGEFEMGAVAMGLSPEAGVIAGFRAGQAIRPEDKDFQANVNEGKKAFRKRANAGAGVFRNVGEVKMQEFLDSLIINTGVADFGKAADKEDIENYYNTNQGAALINKAGYAVPTASAFLSQQNDGTAAKITKGELARAGQYSIDVQSKAEAVRVTNFRDLGRLLKEGGLLNDNLKERRSIGNSGYNGSDTSKMINDAAGGKYGPSKKLY